MARDRSACLAACLSNTKFNVEHRKIIPDLSDPEMHVPQGSQYSTINLHFWASKASILAHRKASFLIFSPQNKNPRNTVIKAFRGFRFITLILFLTRTGFEPVFPRWERGVLTPWPTGNEWRFIVPKLFYRNPHKCQTYFAFKQPHICVQATTFDNPF